ncbi:hypothetical protein IQ62_43605 [Streptomyces scabiei]|uniref:hypothetical protein n=1 Tax=Streptomyces scabiei TaxID=1930 RepID=UPI0004E72118|nr:hypothetical protein [Streptomyces scabiei]KFF95152.1 hypothetical protein IQ62_43605 [Streptomyces scabiei]
MVGGPVADAVRRAVSRITIRITVDGPVAGSLASVQEQVQVAESNVEVERVGVRRGLFTALAMPVG